MFNMFNYLQLKGFSNEKLSEHFEKIFDTNTEINNILMGKFRSCIERNKNFLFG
nr:hypothetical protein [uncultured Leptotrichia sp.]